MSPSAITLLVIVWSGHDIQRYSVERPECERSLEAVKMAAHISEEQYAMQPGISVYCIPLNTSADNTVYELLAPPKPAQVIKAIPMPPHNQ